MHGIRDESIAAGHWLLRRGPDPRVSIRQQKCFAKAAVPSWKFPAAQLSLQTVLRLGVDGEGSFQCSHSVWEVLFAALLILIGK